MNNSSLGRAFLYLAFTLLSVVIVYAQMQLSKNAAISYNGYPVLVWGSLLNVGLGFLLGLEYFLREINKDGHKWSLNRAKLLLIGLPALLFVFANYFYAHGIRVPAIFLNTSVTQLYCLILGFAISTSIVKVKE